MNKHQAVFHFGLMSDIQYADIEPASNFGGHEQRDYRASLGYAKEAMDYWSSLATPLTFIAQLGDLIDGQNAGQYGQGLDFDSPQSEVALQQVLHIWKHCPIPIYHAIGNHELYNFTWDELSHYLNCEKSDSQAQQVISQDEFYHSFSPCPGWRFIMLNSYEENMISPRSEESEQRIRSLLFSKNPNLTKKPPVNFFEGLSKKHQRFVPFNGGFGQTQLTWLKETLSQAQKNNERCLIASHLPCYSKSASPKNVAFDADELRQTLNEYSQEVVAYFAGHRHGGGYAQDPKSGIHHVTIQAPLTHGLCASTITVYKDYLDLVGLGQQKSYSLKF